MNSAAAFCFTKVTIRRASVSYEGEIRLGSAREIGG